MLKGPNGGTPHSREPASISRWAGADACIAGSCHADSCRAEVSPAEPDVYAGAAEGPIVDSRNSALPGAWRDRLLPHHQIPASSRELNPNNIQRNSAAN